MRRSLTDLKKSDFRSLKISSPAGPYLIGALKEMGPVWATAREGALQAVSHSRGHAMRGRSGRGSCRPHQLWRWMWGP